MRKYDRNVALLWNIKWELSAILKYKHVVLNKKCFILPLQMGEDPLIKIEFFFNSKIYLWKSWTKFQNVLTLDMILLGKAMETCCYEFSFLFWPLPLMRPGGFCEVSFINILQSVFMKGKKSWNVLTFYMRTLCIM